MTDVLQRLGKEIEPASSRLSSFSRRTLFEGSCIQKKIQRPKCMFQPVQRKAGARVLSRATNSEVEREATRPLVSPLHVSSNRLYLTLRSVLFTWLLGEPPRHRRCASFKIESSTTTFTQTHFIRRSLGGVRAPCVKLVHSLQAKKSAMGQ